MHQVMVPDEGEEKPRVYLIAAYDKRERALFWTFIAEDAPGHQALAEAASDFVFDRLVTIRADLAVDVAKKLHQRGVDLTDKLTPELAREIGVS